MSVSRTRIVCKPRDIPPDYDGSKLTATRTVRDILQTYKDIEEFKNTKKDDNKPKTVDKFMSFTFWAMLFLILSPPIYFIELSVIKRILGIG